MKKIFLIALISLNINLYSQSLVFYDDFSDNTNSWTIDDNINFSAEVKLGIYYIFNKNDNILTLGKNIFFYKKQKYTIEVRIKQVAGLKNAQFGFFFNADNKGDGIYFLINSEKKFTVYYKKDNKNTTLIPWTYSSAINEFQKYNVLKIKKIDNQIFYFINNVNVGKSELPPVNYSFVGFVIDANTKIFIDYIKIFADKPKINLVQKPIYNKKENLGPNINTQYSEIMPVISPDGKTLYFVRDNYPENIGKNKNHDDIWFSQLTDTGWTKAQNIGIPLNNESHNFIFAVSADNNKLFLNGTYTAFGEPAGNGLSVSYKQSDGSWSIPEKIIIKNFYNKADYQTFTISADQKVLIMAIERDDTKGGIDLYASFLQPDGTYSEPINLGDSINTQFNEGTPFLASDGKTLYFSSDGHPGYGNADIFVSKRLDNTWTHWSTPKNLGPNINSSGWDAYFSVDAKGEYAYLVSTSDSYGLEDIFRIKLQEKARPQPVALIYGNVLEYETDKPLSATIIYKDCDSNQIVKTAISNPADGQYKIVLPVGKKYLVYAQKNNYFSLSAIIDLTEIKEFTEIKQDIYLIPFSSKNSIVLNNIRFKAGSTEFIDESIPELDRIVEFLKLNSNIKVEILGYTNNIGKKEELIKLSLRRANAVKKYLIEKGINASRLITKGYGPENPIADNSTKEGREKNQRVEFKILK